MKWEIEKSRTLVGATQTEVAKGTKLVFGNHTASVS